MPKHLLVDGFNVIRRDAALSQVERANFYGAQQKLVERLSLYRRGTSHRITVVYDGHGSDHPYRRSSQAQGIEVIYSAQGETADDVIKDLAGRDPGLRSQVVVITADRDLASYCRAQGVETLPPEDLLRRSRPGTMPGHADFMHGKREESGWAGHTRKQGNARRTPKNRRKPRGLW